MVINLSDSSIKNHRLNDFAKEYINPKTLAKLYDNCGRHEQPSPNIVWLFSRTLKDFEEKGLLERLSKRQYKKVGV